MPIELPSEWWLAVDDTPRGPYSTAYLQAGVLGGTIRREQLACPLDGTAWRPIAEWPALAGPAIDGPRIRASLPLPDSFTAGDRQLHALTVNYYLIGGPVLCGLSLLSSLTGSSSFQDGTTQQNLEWLLGAFFNLAFSLGTALGCYGAHRLRQCARDSLLWLSASTAVSWLGSHFHGTAFLFLYAGTDPTLVVEDPSTSSAQQVMFGLVCFVLGSGLFLAINVVCLSWVWRVRPQLPPTGRTHPADRNLRCSDERF
ncbi:MAG TPA: DUF4339 domain-containing protein [Planctomycetaceae bacterium]|nr:DUF4339 domain-containing protein [Planctomycetaceae bacterium]